MKGGNRTTIAIMFTKGLYQLIDNPGKVTPVPLCPVYFAGYGTVAARLRAIESKKGVYMQLLKL